jgi:hypothetical protein
MRLRLGRILGQPWLLFGTLFLVCWNIAIAAVLVKHSTQVGMLVDFDWFENGSLIGYWGMGFIALPFTLVGDKFFGANRGTPE